VVGFLRFLGDFIEQSKAGATDLEVIVVWDGLDGSYRRKHQYEGYKQGRKPLVPQAAKEYEFSEEETRENGYWQMSMLMKYLNFTPVKQLCVNDSEADDLIAFLVNHYKRNREIIIVSTDKDFYQLLQEDVVIYRPVPREWITEESMIERTHVHPLNFALYRSVLGNGDKTDNIQGIKGIGDATMLQLFPMLQEAHTVLLDEFQHYCRLQRGVKVRGKDWYAVCLKDIELIRKNYNLMQLYIPPLTFKQTSAILHDLESYDGGFEYPELLTEMQSDGFKHQINFYTFYQEMKNISSNFKK
jgi:5'-3' exonuclease